MADCPCSLHIKKQKGNKAETQNYRPICLTNIGYKIWSGAITRRLMTIINLITDPNQFGYKQNCSCIDALQQVNRFMIKKSKRGCSSHGPNKSF